METIRMETGALEIAESSQDTPAQDNLQSVLAIPQLQQPLPQLPVQTLMGESKLLVSQHQAIKLPSINLERQPLTPTTYLLP